MRKIILNGLLLVIGLGIGGIIGYKMAQKPMEHGIVEGNKNESYEKFKMSFDELFSPSEIINLIKILGNHEICINDYNVYKEAFWGKNPTVPTDKEIKNVQKEILDPVLGLCIEKDDFIAFKPDTTTNLNNIVPECQPQANYDPKSSPYPVRMFKYFALDQESDYKVYMTKGKKDVKLGSTTIKDVTIVMFKLEKTIGTSKLVKYYDIVDDPSVYDRYENPIICP